MKIRVWFLIGLIATLFALGALVIAWSLGFPFIPVSSTLITDLETGRVSENDVTKVEILKFDPGAGWPVTEADYRRKARKDVTTEANKWGLLKQLQLKSIPKQNRNHPSCYYDGIFRIEFRSGAYYFVFYTNSRDNYGTYYSDMMVLPANGLNPNRSRNLDNEDIPNFLKTVDPWYRDASSPPAFTRPGFPDDVP